MDILESLNETLHKALNETYSIGAVVACQDGSVHTIDDIKYEGTMTIYLCDTDENGFSLEVPESTITELLQDAPDEYDSEDYTEIEYTTEYCVRLKDGSEEWFTDKDSADAYFEENKDEVDDYFSKDYDQDGNEGDVEVFYRDMDEGLNVPMNPPEYQDKEMDKLYYALERAIYPLGFALENYSVVKMPNATYDYKIYVAEGNNYKHEIRYDWKNLGDDHTIIYNIDGKEVLKKRAENKEELDAVIEEIKKEYEGHE